MTNPVRYLIENFGKRPEPRPPIIPKPWRMPFFVGLSLLSLLALLLVINYVVGPAVRAQQVDQGASTSSQVKGSNQ
ncbi:MAG: hypothetical protein HGB10_03625 [Coriobacteriia bacterium]|nr:hypothetical protein [Coriobacteriia bacterium]